MVAKGGRFIVWTEEEIQVLRDNCGLIDNWADLSRLLPNRTTRGICSKARDLGLDYELRLEDNSVDPDKRGRSGESGTYVSWTLEEDQILRDNYLEDNDVLAILFTYYRSPIMIKHRMNKLGLVRPNWTEEENQILLDNYDKLQNFEELIALLSNKTASNIARRITDLGLGCPQWDDVINSLITTKPNRTKKSWGKFASECPHIERPTHRAGMCSSCYRTLQAKTNPVKATKCEHTDQPHRSKGLCEPCYKTYRKNNSTILATKCEHTDSSHVGRGLCSACYAKYSREARAVDPLAKKAICHPDRVHVAKGLCKACITKSSTLMRTYGITIEIFWSMVEKQQGRCLVCVRDFDISKKNPYHIDHDHNTGAVRGILCNNCNWGLGLFEDNPEFMRNAALYIERSRLEVVVLH